MTNRENNFTFSLLGVGLLILGLVAFSVGADYLLHLLMNLLGV